MHPRQKFVIALLLLVTLSGCSFEGGYAPVYVPGESRGKTANFHTVRAGETLYSIAFRYGLDYKAIASANGISEPYIIYVDQRLRLVGKRQVADRRQPKTSSKPVEVSPEETVISKSQASNIRWRWPIDGEVISQFSLDGTLNKGVDISGRLGESVMAAADGVVVYAGGGLRGYGKLVILKHSNNFLSAYGHNRAIRVKEGQNVKGGDVLAEIGSSGTDREMLHFEIRRDGKPVDPLIYLPDRSM